MNTPNQIQMFLSMFLMHLPTLIVCLVACIVILTKRGTASRGSLWALLGFGSVLLLSVVMPIMHAAVQGWVFHSGQHADRMWAYTAATIVSTVLHASTYVFFLLAVLAGRTTPDSTSSTPLTSQ